MQDFRNLKVWQKAHEYVLLVYRGSGGFPAHETSGYGVNCGGRACRSLQISPKVPDAARTPISRDS
jgi:hypothetical protein